MNTNATTCQAEGCTDAANHYVREVERGERRFAAWAFTTDADAATYCAAHCVEEVNRRNNGTAVDGVVTDAQGRRWRQDWR